MGRVEHPDERSLLHSTSEQFRERYVLRSGMEWKKDGNKQKKSQTQHFDQNRSKQVTCYHTQRDVR